MPSDFQHDDPRPRRIRLTRRSWFFPLLLLVGPMVGRAAILGGGLATMSACGGPTHAECEESYDLCEQTCTFDVDAGIEADWAPCVQLCEEEYGLCADAAEAELERREANAAAAEAAALVCATVAVCSLEAADDEGWEDEGWEDEGWEDEGWEDEGDDYGEDWGERKGGRALEIEALPPPLDMPG